MERPAAGVTEAASVITLQRERHERQRKMLNYRDGVGEAGLLSHKRLNGTNGLLPCNVYVSLTLIDHIHFKRHSVLDVKHYKL